MKIVCLRDSLLDAVNIVQKAVSSKSNLPILEGILIECTDKLKLVGNDLETGIECIVEADIIEKGSIVINSKMFGDIIRKLPDLQVVIETGENDMVMIECSNSKFEINGLPSQGFPELPEIKSERSFQISQEILKDMIRQTNFAVSIDNTRPILTGSLLEVNENNIIMVACDSFRVALRKSELQKESFDVRIVIPGKAMNEVSKIFKDTDEIVNILTTKNQIMFQIDSFKMVTRLLDGEYFKYKSFIPEEFTTNVLVKRQDLLSSIERAALIISTDERRYPLNIDVNDDSLHVYSKSNLGNVNEVINADVEGDNLEMRFNPKYFIEVLRVIEDERIELCFTNDIGPCVIRPIDGDKYIYLIVPLRK